jgi:hypothetical protein
MRTSSSVNEFGEDVEKRADWLLKDIRQLNTSTATLNGGTLLSTKANNTFFSLH